VDECLPPTYGDIDFICKDCPELCSECIDYETCDICTSEGFLHLDECVEICPSEFYHDYVDN